MIPNPNHTLDWDRYQYVRSNPVRFVDPCGNRACEQEFDGSNRCEKESEPNPPYPDFDIKGCHWVLMTPKGNGIITWYVIETINDYSIKNPDDLSDQAYYRKQGSVKINGTNWYWKNDSWNRSNLSCAFANSQHCVTPFENRSLNHPFTGAVSSNSSILTGWDKYIFLQVFPTNPLDKIFQNGLVVNAYDNCPGCGLNHVDLLTSRLIDKFGYNGKGDDAKVYIWICIPNPTSPGRKYMSE